MGEERNKKRREYYQRNKEKILAANRRWRAENKEKVALGNKKKYKRNKEKIKAKQREYYQKNREGILEKKRQYYEENREKYSEASRKKRSRRYFGGKKYKVLRRDGHRCSLCTSVSDLIVHHKNFSIKDNSLSNLQTLCRSCHSKIHSEKIKRCKATGKYIGGQNGR